MKRHNKIINYFNLIVKWFEENYKNKKKIIIGYNKLWKNKLDMGKKNNRNFYQIPFKILLDKLKMKMENNNINVIIREESYTSKCDALNLEEVCKHDIYDGKRVKRGLFESKTGKLINADLNGAINIMRKHMKNINKKFTEIKGKHLCNPENINIMKEYDKKHKKKGITKTKINNLIKKIKTKNSELKMNRKNNSSNIKITIKYMDRVIGNIKEINKIYSVKLNLFNQRIKAHGKMKLSDVLIV